MSRDSLRPLLSAASTALAGLIPMIAQAQQNAADEEPPPPEQVTDVRGSWWAKLYEPEFLHRVSRGHRGADRGHHHGYHLCGRDAPVRAGGGAARHDTEQAVQPDRRRKQRVVTVLELMRSVARWVILVAAWCGCSPPRGWTFARCSPARASSAWPWASAPNLVRDLVSGFFILLEAELPWATMCRSPATSAWSIDRHPGHSPARPQQPAPLSSQWRHRGGHRL